MKKKTASLGVRIPQATYQIIREISLSRGRTPIDLLAEYAEETARMHRFCHIEFRDTPLGRTAYVQGTRTAVWLIYDLLRQNNGDIAKTAALHEWPTTKVRADYAKAYPHEIERLICRAHAMNEEDLRQLNAG